MLEKLVQKELEHGTEETRRGADRCHPASDRSRISQPQKPLSSLQRSRDHAADRLSLAKGVRRPEAGTGATAEGVGERERSSAPPGDRAIAGEAGLEGRGGRRLLNPERRRCAVQHARATRGPVTQ